MTQRCNWLNQNGVQCGQPLGHPCEHGNGLLTPNASNDTWHEFIEAKPDVPRVEKFGAVFTDKSSVKQCFWCGPNGRCIYELGHTLPHKETVTE
jgi:hypothetical protein